MEAPSNRNRIHGHDLEAELDYRFRDPELLRLALVHRTYAYENPATEREDQERLEFLGDAVFALSIAHALHRLSERLTEGEMTRLRASLVCERAQAGIARSIGLGERLLLGRGEESTGGRMKSSNLSNALEAVIGAVFLDGGWQEAERVLFHLYGDRIAEAVSGREDHDAKSRLIETVQAMVPRRTVSFRIVQETGPAHERVFLAEALVDGAVIGTGSGETKKAAEQQAAANALAALAKR